MNELEFAEQQFLEKLERSLRCIRSGERLSLEASMEELCKLLLLQICLERKNGQSLSTFVNDFLQSKEEMSIFYQRVFDRFAPSYIFIGWDSLKLGRETIEKVAQELTKSSLFEEDQAAKARAFTEFLQHYYSGYLSEYSTPQALNEYIWDVINPQKVCSIADPCCGLGGGLVEGISRSSHTLLVKGLEINRSVANIANLHLMMYGYEAGTVDCTDMFEANGFSNDGPFDALISHLPLRHRMINSSKKNESSRAFSSSVHEDVVIKMILRLLRPGGLAAIVVSDELLMSQYRAGNRLWLSDNYQILNITRFEGLSFNGDLVERPYNVLFLRNSATKTDECLATLINYGSEKRDIKAAAMSLRNAIYSRVLELPHDNHLRRFSLSNEKVWNVNLFYAREIISWKYETCLLGDLVIHDRQRASIKETSKYNQLTVKNKGLGVVERKDKYIWSASSSGNARFIARSGQLIVSSLDADKGAVGIVPKTLDGALVSRNYYLFTITSQRIDPDYLAMVLSSEPVLKQIVYQKSDNIMSRISLEKIVSLVIPLPALDEQKRLVNTLIYRMRKAIRAQEELESEQIRFARMLYGPE